MEATYTANEELRARCNETLTRLRWNKAEMAIRIGIHRSIVSQYLNGKKVSNVERVETAIETFLEEIEAAAESEDTSVEKNVTKPLPKKLEFFESKDAMGIIGVCNLCQKNQEIGIVVGKSGFGKTHTLLKYAKLPRVAYLECNETMNAKDLIRRIETAIGLPKGSGSIDERMEKVAQFFKVNRGYLLIVDEADKLITKYTQKKIEMLRDLYKDGSGVAIVLAGEPALESCIKSFDERLANRMAFYYKLKGLSMDEVEKYFSNFEVEEHAMEEFMQRAVNKGNGCFRLLDRTLNNVIRILSSKGQTKITMNIIREASNMMML